MKYRRTLYELRRLALGMSGLVWFALACGVPAALCDAGYLSEKGAWILFLAWALTMPFVSVGTMELMMENDW